MQNPIFDWFLSNLYFFRIETPVTPTTQIEIDLTWNALVDHYKIPTSQATQPLPKSGQSPTASTATPTATSTSETAPLPAAKKLPNNILIIASDLEFKKNMDDFKHESVARKQARLVSFRLNGETTDYAKYFRCVTERIRRVPGSSYLKLVLWTDPTRTLIWKRCMAFVTTSFGVAIQRFSRIFPHWKLKFSFPPFHRHNKALADVLLNVQSNGNGDLKGNQDAKKEVATNLLKVLVLSRKEHTL